MGTTALAPEGEAGLEPEAPQPLPALLQVAEAFRGEGPTGLQ